jgi:hypothetical protein
MSLRVSFRYKVSLLNELLHTQGPFQRESLGAFSHGVAA